MWTLEQTRHPDDELAGEVDLAEEWSGTWQACCNTRDFEQQRSHLFDSGGGAGSGGRMGEIADARAWLRSRTDRKHIEVELVRREMLELGWKAVFTQAAGNRRLLP